MKTLIAALSVIVALPCAAQSNGGRGDTPPATCVEGDFFTRTGASPAACACGATNNWTCITAGGGGVPAGAILLIKSGTCPAGFEEDTDLDGVTLVGTLAAHGDVGTTGGSDSITPAGTNTAPTFTGTPFTSVINHTHPVTDPGHTHNQGLRNSGTAGTAGIQGASTANNATITNGVPSATTGITTSNPAGGVASITPAGSVTAPTFTGTEFDNRSAFRKVIFCRKT